MIAGILNGIQVVIVILLIVGETIQSLTVSMPSWRLSRNFTLDGSFVFCFLGSIDI